MYSLIRSRRAFTLIEVMVVVVILGILAAIIVPRVVARPEQAKMVKAKADVQNLDDALELYNLDNGNYPSTAQGLSALVTKPDGSPIPANWTGYLKQMPTDPWGNPYQYKQPGDHGAYDVWSDGKDKSANKPIGNWNVHDK